MVILFWSILQSSFCFEELSFSHRYILTLPGLLESLMVVEQLTCCLNSYWREHVKLFFRHVLWGLGEVPWICLLRVFGVTESRVLCSVCFCPQSFSCVLMYEQLKKPLNAPFQCRNQKSRVRYVTNNLKKLFATCLLISSWTILGYGTSGGHSALLEKWWEVGNKKSSLSIFRTFLPSKPWSYSST